MNNLPTVSVMIITYNHEMYIRETIDSVLAQDYPNMEIVVSDDASTDNTPSIVRDYALKHPLVVKAILATVNKGITANCNMALNHCSGSLVAIMGGDDVFLPGKIKAQAIEFVEDCDLVLSYHSVDVFLSDTNETLYLSNQTIREDTNSAEEIIERGGIPGASSVMVRRSACPEGGFDDRLPTVSDWLFFIEVALRGRVRKIPGLYGRYRKHSKGASNRTLELLDESLRTLDLVLEKHPERIDLIGSCKKGKARYIAGEGFRQLKEDHRLSNTLSRKAIKLDPSNFRYWLLYCVSSFKWSSGFFGGIVAKYKYSLKRVQS